MTFSLEESSKPHMQQQFPLADQKLGLVVGRTTLMAAPAAQPETIMFTAASP